MNKRGKWFTCIALSLVMTMFSGCSFLNGLLGSEGNESVKDSSNSLRSEESKDDGEVEEEAMLNITAPDGVVYPYIATVKQYLEAGASANVGHYGGAVNQYKGIDVEWECDLKNVANYVVEYATKADYSDAIQETVTDTSIALFNLYKGTTYYLRVSACDGQGEVLSSATSTFKTTDMGPRFMKIDGIYNVRDLGGYSISNGKTTVQGLLYRGGSLTPADVYSHNLTDNGKAYMSETLGIKTEIDFRSPTETDGVMESVIPGAKLTYVTLGGYSDAFNRYAPAYKEAFSILANKKNYPIYMHCTGGADRTGTVSFLLNALLGVSELECIQDYELTTFSIYGTRNTKQGAYASYCQEFLETLNTYKGRTLQEKVESYLLSIGLTADEIYNIRAIMCGEPSRDYASAQATFVEDVDKDFTINVHSDQLTKALYIADQRIGYIQTDSVMKISASEMPKLPNGIVSGKVVLMNDQELPFTFTYEGVDYIELDEYMAFTNGVITLDQTTSLVTGTMAVGYGQKVCVRMQATLSGDHGGITVMIGSYGCYIRGGEFRAMQMASGGAITETARNTGLGVDVHSFDEGDTLLFLTVDIVENKPVMTIETLKNGTKRTYTYTYQSRIAGEIESENANVTFSIKTPDCSALNIYTSNAWENKA